MTEARCRCAIVALVTSAIALTGCDMMLVELGRGQISQVLVDRTFPTGLRPYDGCPSIDLPYGTGPTGGRLVVAPLSEGCLLAVHMNEAVLLNAGTMSLWADALAGYDMSALIAIDVIIDQFSIDGGRALPLGLDRVQALSIALDERVLVKRKDLENVGEEEETRIPIPQSLVDSFEQALDERRAFTGALDIRLVLKPDVQIPRILHVRTLLQPVLLIDGWNAAF